MSKERNILDEIVDIVAPMSGTDVEYWQRRDRNRDRFSRDGKTDFMIRTRAADSIGNYIDSVYSSFGDRISPKMERRLQRMMKENGHRDYDYLPERTDLK